MNLSLLALPLLKNPLGATWDLLPTLRWVDYRLSKTHELNSNAAHNDGQPGAFLALHRRPCLSLRLQMIAFSIHSRVPMPLLLRCLKLRRRHAWAAHVHQTFLQNSHSDSTNHHALLTLVHEDSWLAWNFFGCFVDPTMLQPSPHYHSRH